MTMRFALLCFLSLLSGFAAASNFVVLTLPRGVEIQVPKNWWVLSQQFDEAAKTAMEASFDNAGIDLPEGTSVTLLAANSMPRTTYASVRVDSSTPVLGPPSEIAKVTASELKEYENDMQLNLQQLLSQQGNKILNFYGTRPANISGHPTLITKYKRTGPKGPVQVAIIQIFTHSQDLNIALSYRESETALWKPVIAKIQKSITVRRWP